MHSLNLLSDTEFLSLVEGELFIKLDHNHGSKCCGCSAYPFFTGGRLRRLEESAFLFARWRDESCRLLYKDETICRYLYVALQLIKAAAAPVEQREEALEDLHPTETSYQAVLARRVAEEKKKSCR